LLSQKGLQPLIRKNDRSEAWNRLICGCPSSACEVVCSLRSLINDDRSGLGSFSSEIDDMPRHERHLGTVDVQSDYRDSTLFVSLLSRHERRLNAYILSLVPNWSDAEEISQEVKMRLWEQFDKYDPERDFGAWSRTIAYYLVLSYRQDVAKRRTRFSDAVVEAIALQVETDSSQIERRHYALEKCMERLGDGERAMLMAWCVDHKTARQISAALGRSFEATRKSILRIRLQLARCIRQRLLGETVP
jgi:RNA polymerase sigma-70 factor, ECF subfamily